MALIIYGMLWEFNYKLNLNLERQAKAYLNEVARQNVNLVENKLADSFSFLKSMAVAISKYDDITSKEVIDIIDSQTRYNHLFDRMIIITSDGTAHVNDGMILDVSEKSYFQKSLKGENAISKFEPSKIDGRNRIVMSVPIYKDDKIAGVLGIDYSVESIQNLFHADIFDGHGKSDIINTDGEFITKSESSKLYKTYFEALDNVALQEKNIDQFKQDLKSKKNGILIFYYKNKLRYTSYYPIQLNDWYLLTSVSKDVISKQSEEITKLGFYLTVKVILLLLLFTWYSTSIQKKNVCLLQKSKQTQETLISNIPGGVIRCFYDKGLTITYLSEGFYKMTGFQESDINTIFENKYENMIVEEDYAGWEKNFKKQMQSKHHYEMEYRLKKKDGSLLWVLDKGKIIKREKEKNIIYCVLVDITKSKLAQQELLLSDERYRLIMEKTDSIMYEWNLVNDSVTFSDIWHKKFGYPSITENFLGKLKEHNILHENDIEKYLELMIAAKNGEQNGETVVRIRKLNGEYIWCRMYLSAILDKNKIPVKAIGIVIDIDKEKREAQLMQNKAQRDSLTGLYNKGATESSIQSFLENKGKNQLHALIVIDVDNFKMINDKLGHLTGDDVLIDVTEKITKLFRTSDIIGRIGGDEFVVFLKNIRSVTVAKESAKEICKAFHDSFIGENKDYKISGSIGIALYNKDGQTYSELFKNADTALYCAKRKGKDQYAFFEDSN